MDTRDPVAVVARAQRFFDEAEALISAGHPAMGVVRCVSAIEIFIKRAFIEPYLRMGPLADNVELAEVILRALLDEPTRWRNRLAPLLRSVWGIELDRLDSWREMGRAWALRNAIVHEGAECTAPQAWDVLRSGRTLTEALLLCRLEAGPAVRSPLLLDGAP